jgi:LacI family transcriptional regulator
VEYGASAQNRPCGNAATPLHPAFDKLTIMEKTPRLKDIADLANVSIGTVDRVLHDRGRVAADTKEKVLRIAKEIGYQPNIHASILSGSSRSYRLCCLVPTNGMDPFWDQVHEGFQKALSQIGDQNVEVDLVEFDLFSPADFTEKVSRLRLGKYNGLIVAPVFQREYEGLRKAIHRSEIPFVVINTLIKDEDPSFLCYIGPHAYQSGRLAARLLGQHCGAGDKVLMIPLEQDYRNAQHMLEKERGFRDCFSEIAPQVKVITADFEDYNDPKALGNFVTDMILQHPTIKGIYTSASRISKVAASMEELKIDHIKLIGYDTLDENLTYLNKGKITYLINQNPRLMGYLGMIYLAKYLVFKSCPEQYNYLPLDVVLPENVSYFQNHYLLHDILFIPFM